MKRNIFLLGLALAAVSCGGSTDGYTITGRLKNCGELGKSGQVILAYQDEGKRITDTVNVVNGRFKLTGHIDHPDFAYLFSTQQDKKKLNWRVSFFLDNDRYSIKFNNGKLSKMEGGVNDKLFNEVSKHQTMLDKKYDIESIDRQLQTTGTPMYRREQLIPIRHEYDSVVKAYTDSIIAANAPSYFSLYKTSQSITKDANLDSIRKELEIYLKDDRFKDDPRLMRMIDIIDKKRRP